MNPYLEPQGFLGTGASLLADVTVLAYLLLIIPAMIAGFIFARRKLHRPHHKWTMTGITIVNWVLIIFLMLVAYRFDVAPNIAAQPNNTRYLLPTIHGLFGIPAQLLATFVVLRMFREDSQVRRAKARGETSVSKYWFKRAKLVMRLTLTLWLITAALGVLSYLTRYDVIPAFALRAEVAEPVSTQELLAPLGTPEADSPLATDELAPADEPSPLPPVETDAVDAVETEALEPLATAAVRVETEALEPLATEEPADATSTRRPSATRPPSRTPVPPAETEAAEPLATAETAAETPTRRPAATRPPSRTPMRPVETEAVEPVETEELTSDTPTPRPSATRRPTRTPVPPVETEEATEVWVGAVVG